MEGVPLDTARMAGAGRYSTLVFPNLGRAFLQPLKKPGNFEGPAIIYPLNRVAETPLDAFTVVDLMRATLGVGPRPAGREDGPGRGADRLAPQESAMVDEVGITAQSQRAMKQAGRMCMGMSIPGTGHTAYVFDILTTNGERWKVTRRYSEFLELDKKLKQV